MSGASRTPGLQDRFLNAARRARAPVAMFLMKGVKLQGVITGFDAFSLLLRRDGQSQLVYKHSVSTIQAELPDSEFAGLEHRAADGLQDRFLAATASQGEPVTVFLVNGVMLSGVLEGFDAFALLIRRGVQRQLVYKHAVSTLQPAHALVLAPDPADVSA